MSPRLDPAADPGARPGADPEPDVGPDLGRRSVVRAAALAPLAPLAAALAGCTGAGSSSAPSTPSAGRSAPSAPRSSPSSSASAGSSPSASGGSSGGTGATSGVRLRPGPQRLVARGIDVPWSIVFLPGGDALVSSRDTGRILRVSRTGRDRGRKRVVATVPGVVSNISQGGEAGLLGLALHPGFPDRPWLYAYHSTASDNRVVRMRYRRGRLGRPRVVLDGIEMSVHHNGGGMVFGPDGHLFVSTGDAEDTANAQDRSSLNGKILRVTDTGGVPRGNPFGTRVWTYGHRNVEGLAVDAGGQLWASEFGDQAKDELNRIDRGSDYGWPAVEGADGPGGYHDPIATWATDACSPSGLAVLHGRAWLGALRGECVYSVDLAGSERGRVRRWFAGEHGRMRAVAAAPDGSLWLGTSNRDGRAAPRAGDDRLMRVPFA